MERNKLSKEYFAEVANQWDDLRAGYFTEYMRDEAVSLIDIRPDHIVADVGCGTGFMIHALAPRVKEVIGFDQSKQMIDIAEENLKNYKNVTIILSDGDSLPVAGGFFDAVFSNMYLHHTIDPLKAIREMYRITRPGGWIVLIDMDLHNNEWMKEAMADSWLGFKREDIIAWFTDAGFKNTEITCAKGSCCTVSPDGEKLAIGIFVACGHK